MPTLTPSPTTTSYGPAERLSAPATVDRVIAGFSGAVYGLSPQPHLVETAATPGWANGRAVRMCLSYAVVRVPSDPENPANFLALGAARAAVIARAAAAPVPAWLRDQIMRMRYPPLYEAVRTSLQAQPGRNRQQLEEHVEAHIGDALNCMFPGRHHPELVRRRAGNVPRLSDSRRSTLVHVDGLVVPGYRIVVNPHLIAVGARLGDRFLTAVIPQMFDSLITPTFVTRSR